MKARNAPVSFFMKELRFRLHAENGPTPRNFFACMLWTGAIEGLSRPSSPCIQAEEMKMKSSILCCRIIFPPPHLPDSLLVLFARIRPSPRHGSIQSLGGSSASLSHSRSGYGPSPPAVLSHYFAIKDSLFCKRKTGLGGAFFYALSDTGFV